jgi:glutaminase
MSYPSLGDATITIPSSDLKDIVLAAVGISPSQSAAENIASISQASVVSNPMLIWGAIAVAAFFILRK